MKTPTQYGSENEETSFIRRIAAPDRANSKRKQKKRMAVVGATVGLMAASAVVGYAAMRQGGMTTPTVSTEQLGAKVQAQYGDDDEAPDDTVYPSFGELDQNNNGIVEQAEYFNWLEDKLKKDTAMVDAANIPQSIKDDFIRKIENNFDQQGPCGERAFRRMKKNKLTLKETNYQTFLYSIQEFCPSEPINITQELLDKYAPTTAPPAYSTYTQPEETLTRAEEKEVQEQVKEEIAKAEAYTGNELTTAEENKIEEQVRSEYIEEKKEEEPLSRAEEKEVQEQVEEEIAKAEEYNGGDLSPAQEEKIEEQVREEYVEEKTEKRSFRGGPETDTTDKNYMTKEEFRQKLLNHFVQENQYLDDVIAKANAEYEALTAKIKSLDDCIEQAANKFGWYGVYEEAPHFEQAVDWVENVCTKN